MTTPRLPRDVRTAMTLLWCAIAAGVAETLLFVSQAVITGAVADIAPQAGLRMLIYLALALLVMRLRHGGNRSRMLVTIVIGVFGTLSMVVSPIVWLAAGNSPLQFLATAHGGTLVFTALRVLHVIAVLAAMVYLFRPAANGFYRPKALGR